MNKIYILIALLPQLFYTLVHGQESPCPQYFTYIIKPGSDETIGLIEIQSPPRTGELRLKVALQVGAELPTRYIGRLNLVRSPEAIRQGRSLLYHVYFPLRHPIPKLIGIWFNGERYCWGPDVTANFVTTITLQHTLSLPNARSQNYHPSGPYHQNWRPISTRQWNTPNKSTVNSQDIDRSQKIDFSHESDHFFLNMIPDRQPSSYNVPEFSIFPNQNARQTPRPILRPISRPTSAKPTPQDDDNDSINNSECGINNFINGPNLLIVNGNETSRGRWPWLVALFHAMEEGHLFLCAGTILTKKHIITAAHCLISSNFGDDIIYREPNVLLVSLGRFKLTDWHERGTVNREVASYKIHPDYTHTSTGDSDLAILILKTPVEYSSFIQPICLWTGSNKLEDIVNKRGYVVGWGRDELGNNFTVKPRMVNVPIVSQADCLWSHHVFRHLTSNRTLCAGFRNQTGPCNGDSGSGLMLFDDTTERYHLRGIVSRSAINNQDICDLKKYIVYVDVAKYVPWIQQQIFPLIFPLR